jgi:hypothetical protein
MIPLYLNIGSPPALPAGAGSLETPSSQRNSLPFLLRGQKGQKAAFQKDLAQQNVANPVCAAIL